MQRTTTILVWLKLMQVLYKRCPKCCQTLPSELFGKNKRVKDGLAAYCKACFRTRSSESYSKHADTRREAGRKHYKARHWADNLIYGSKSSARSRKLEHNITAEHLKYLWHIQEGKCYWLGIPLGDSTVLSNRHPSKPSLDRLDPTRGYVKGNVVISSSFANMGRSECSEEDFRDFLYDTKLEEAYNSFK